MISLLVLVFILIFGVQQNLEKPPPDAKLRGLYLFACAASGAVSGGLCIVFWESTKWFCGGLGGFMLGMMIQSWRSGGLIQGSVGWRYFLYIREYTLEHCYVV